MIRNIIFDFGNVLGWTLADDTTKTYVADSSVRQQIRNVVFDPADWDRLNRGTMTDEEMFQRICSRLPEHLHQDAITVYDNWTNTSRPVPGMAHLVSELKEKGYRLYLLSNATLTFSERYRLVPWMSALLEQFDGLVFSAVVGMAKPDREIYEYVLNTYSLNADECLFVDDYQENIAGAEKLGIQGYRFDGDSEKLKKYIFSQED